MRADALIGVRALAHWDFAARPHARAPRTREHGMPRHLAPFLRDSRGATSIEYAVMAAIFAFAIIASAPLVGKALDDRFKAAADGVAAAH